MTHALRQLRVSKGWTQAELGKRAGLVQQRVSLLERGLKSKPDETEKILRAFGLKNQKDE